MRKSQQGASYIAILFGVVLLQLQLKLPLRYGQRIGTIKSSILKLKVY
jgi:hypothetical protein